METQKIRQANLRKIEGCYSSQRVLADALDWTPGFINQLLIGHRGIGEKTARKIENKLGLPHLALDNMAFPNTISPAIPLGNAEAAPTLGMCKKIPVVGEAQLGDNGHWYELEYPVGHGDGYLAFPAKDNNAYALRCRGDSMKPRIQNGEFVIVEPNRAAQPGDEVLVKSKDDRVMVKRLLWRRDGLVHLLSVNEAHPSISLAETDIDAIHPIAGIFNSAIWSKD